MIRCDLGFRDAQPGCNAFSERFVRSIKDECLDRMILFDEASLRRILREYVAHYRFLEPLARVGSTNDPIHRSERLGGMLNFYYREAA